MNEIYRVKPKVTENKVSPVGFFEKPYPELLNPLEKPDKGSDGEYKWCYYLILPFSDIPIPFEICSTEKGVPRRKMSKWAVKSTSDAAHEVREQVADMLELPIRIL